MIYLRQRARAKVKSALAAHPRLFIPTYRAFGPRDTQRLLISDDTELVIEAYPRSSNTFSVIAFELAQAKSVKIAHHLHVSAQVLRGAERGIPVLVPIRDPVAAVKSLKVIYPHLDENREIEHWIRFYDSISKVTSQVLLADFRDIVSDYGEVLDRLNAKFGSDFRRFDHTKANVAEVFRRIEEIDRRHRGGSVEFVARPSAERRQLRKEAPFAFDSALVADARAMYAEMVRH